MFPVAVTVRISLYRFDLLLDLVCLVLWVAIAALGTRIRLASCGLSAMEHPVLCSATVAFSENQHLSLHVLNRPFTVPSYPILNKIKAHALMSC